MTANYTNVQKNLFIRINFESLLATFLYGNYEIQKFTFLIFFVRNPCRLMQIDDVAVKLDLN